MFVWSNYFLTTSFTGIWVSKNLGPTLKNSPFANVKILAGDDQRWEMPLYFGLMELGAPDVMNYVDMFGVHWYLDNFLPAFFNDDTSLIPHNQY